MTKPKPSDLKPIDWVGVEQDFRAGIKPLRVIATQYGCAHSLIAKRAKREAWQRDLKPRVHARADELVHKAQLAQVNRALVNARGEHKERESQTVESGAQAEVTVRLGHRNDIARARRLAVTLLAELETVVDRPELYGMLYDALANPDEPALDALRDMAALVASLPGRVKTMKDLADTLHKVIGMEREAFGLDTAAGTEGRPLVIIRDYTGRGDADAPLREEAIS